MSITLIYHNIERNRAERIGQYLKSCGYEINYAPVGLQLGTPEWKAAVVQDLRKSEVVILLLTEHSVTDEWVAWRSDMALDLNRSFIPVLLDNSLPDHSYWCLPQLVFRYNWLQLRSEFWDKDIQNLERCLPKSSVTPNCFISYSRSNEDIAKRLRSDLEESSIRVWRDVDDIPAGSSWDDQISGAIVACSHVLFIVTSQSV